MKLMILDGNSVIYRAFYGIRPLNTKDGQPTNAVFGFLNILQSLRTDEPCDALCVAFDLHGKTFRHVQYEDYKANRHEMPDELAVQLPIMKDILRAMNIPVYECQGWEADDVIGTVSRICTESGWDCIIVTGDRDSLQLVSERVIVRLVTSRQGKTGTTRYTEDVFRAEYGFQPERLVDLKGLMGDSSDNIPGVPGVGSKTALALIQKFGSFRNVYENLETSEIRESLQKKLADNRDLAELSMELATIRRDAPITFQPEDARCRETQRAELLAIFERLEFWKLIDRYGLRDAQPATPMVAPTACALATLPDDPTPCAVCPDAVWNEISITTRNGTITVGFEENRTYFERLFSSVGEKYCANLKQMLRDCAKHGLEARGFTFDAALAGYVLNPSQGDYSPERLAAAYLSREIEHTPAAVSAATFDLAAELSSHMDAEGLSNLYRDIELPLCRVLAEMEETGILVDRDALMAFQKILSDRIQSAQAQVYSLTGEEFNINSPRALGEVLFEHMGLPSAKKTKTGYATGAEVLEKLKSESPVAQAVLDYRMLTKLHSTYAEGLLKMIAPDGRIHTTFQNTVTATGRLSSTDPNLQNIPIRTELGSEIRKMFVARPGYVLVDADYSQIELRVLSHMANDTAMQHAFQSGEDIHTLTASQVFSVPLSEVTPQMRRSAKAVNFGIVYGISDFSLSKDIGVSRREARTYIDTYLQKYEGVRNYMHDVTEAAKRDGFVRTLFGRRRFLPELKSSNFALRSFGERAAMNTPIQGTAADLIKLSMIRVADALREISKDAHLVLQVHDELIVECPEAEQAAVMSVITREMQNVSSLAVPLTAEAKAGKSWYDAK